MTGRFVHYLTKPSSIADLGGDDALTACSYVVSLVPFSLRNILNRERRRPPLLLAALPHQAPQTVIPSRRTHRDKGEPRRWCPEVVLP